MHFASFAGVATWLRRPFDRKGLPCLLSLLMVEIRALMYKVPPIFFVFPKIRRPARMSPSLSLPPHFLTSCIRRRSDQLVVAPGAAGRAYGHEPRNDPQTSSSNL